MLEKAKIGIEEGYIFGDAGEGFIRINLACPVAMVEEILERIRAALV